MGNRFPGDGHEEGNSRRQLLDSAGQNRVRAILAMFSQKPPAMAKPPRGGSDHATIGSRQAYESSEGGDETPSPTRPSVDRPGRCSTLTSAT